MNKKNLKVCKMKIKPGRFKTINNNNKQKMLK